MLQAAYADWLAKDDSKAITAFLDDPSIKLLQVSLAKGGDGQLQVRLDNTAGFPKGCFYQVRQQLASGGVSPLRSSPPHAKAPGTSAASNVLSVDTEADSSIQTTVVDAACQLQLLAHTASRARYWWFLALQSPLDCVLCA